MPKPDWYSVTVEDVDGVQEHVLTMEFRGRTIRARAMQWQYPRFRYGCQGDDAWFEGWTGGEGDGWVRLPELPATH